MGKKGYNKAKSTGKRKAGKRKASKKKKVSGMTKSQMFQFMRHRYQTEEE